MDLKHLVAKLTSVALILSGLYQIVLSMKAIFFTYPHLATIQEGLVEKALIIYATMVIDGIYGIALLVKPTKEVKIIHIFFGILIFVVSIFFAIQ